jgi:hypothetical protein
LLSPFLREEPLPGPPLKGREANRSYLPSLQVRAGERFFLCPSKFHYPHIIISSRRYLWIIVGFYPFLNTMLE